MVARKGVLLVFVDSVPFTAVGVEVEDLLELGRAPGENLDLVLAFTVSQPPSSSFWVGVKLCKLSTDLGVLRPLKGQLISKCLFGAIISTKKTTKLLISCLASKKRSNQKNKGALLN